MSLTYSLLQARLGNIWLTAAEGANGEARRAFYWRHIFAARGTVFWEPKGKRK